MQSGAGAGADPVLDCGQPSGHNQVPNGSHQPQLSGHRSEAIMSECMHSSRPDLAQDPVRLVKVLAVQQVGLASSSSHDAIAKPLATIAVVLTSRQMPVGSRGRSEQLQRVTSAFTAIGRIASLQQLTISAWDADVHRDSTDVGVDAVECLAALGVLQQLTALVLNVVPCSAAASLPPLPALRVRRSSCSAQRICTGGKHVMRHTSVTRRDCSVVLGRGHESLGVWRWTLKVAAALFVSID